MALDMDSAWSEMLAGTAGNSSSSGIGGDGPAGPSRQKSCNACVRGKRRCDKRAPRCSRCAARDVDCVYQRMPRRGPHSPLGGERVAGEMRDLAEMGEMGEEEEADLTLDMMDGLAPSTGADDLSTTTGHASLTTNGPDGLSTDTGLLNHNNNNNVNNNHNNHTSSLPFNFSLPDMFPSTASSGDCWSLPNFLPDNDKLQFPQVPLGPLAETTTTPISLPHHQQEPRPVRDLSLLKCDESCIDTDPLQVHDPRSRIGYLVASLTALPAVLVQTRALPFMHPRLWAGQLPGPILSAFAAATAYTAGSPQNRAWTVKLMADAGRDIQREGERIAAPPSPADRLGRTQALMISCVMRVFDSDVGFRVAAERHMALLMAWTKDLVDLRDELEEEEAISPRGLANQVPPKSWESWIFLESLRRTLMASYAFICTVSWLRSEKPDADLCHKKPCFTASKHLWQAASSVDFFRAWRERPRYWIENLGFKDFWMYGRAADVDDFTQLILTSRVGVDAMEHFMEGDVSIPV